jgi:hypothetical protein
LWYSFLILRFPFGGVFSKIVGAVKRFCISHSSAILVASLGNRGGVTAAHGEAGISWICFHSLSWRSMHRSKWWKGVYVYASNGNPTLRTMLLYQYLDVVSRPTFKKGKLCR